MIFYFTNQRSIFVGLISMRLTAELGLEASLGAGKASRNLCVSPYLYINSYISLRI